MSAAGIWEISIKQALGKLRAPSALVPAIEKLGFSVVPIVGQDAEEAGALPLHHRDRFDRMLVAQAGRLEATLVSRDRVFDLDEVPVLTSVSSSTRAVPPCSA